MKSESRKHTASVYVALTDRESWMIEHARSIKQAASTPHRPDRLSRPELVRIALWDYFYVHLPAEIVQEAANEMLPDILRRPPPSVDPVPQRPGEPVSGGTPGIQDGSGVKDMDA